MPCPAQPSLLPLLSARLPLPPHIHALGSTSACTNALVLFVCMLQASSMTAILEYGSISLLGVGKKKKKNDGHDERVHKIEKIFTNWALSANGFSDPPSLTLSVQRRLPMGALSCGRGDLSLFLCALCCTAPSCRFVCVCYLVDGE